MGISREAIDEWEEYVPDVEGQRELFFDDPDEAMTVEIRFLSRDDLKQYTRAIERANRGQPASKADTKLAEQMFSENVRNVRNLVIADVPIETGADLYASNEVELLRDISEALIVRSKIDNGLAKKLRRQCGSPSSRRQNKKDGDAPDATQQSVPTIPEIQDHQMKSNDCQMPQNDRVETAMKKQTKAYHFDGIRDADVAQKVN